MIANHGKSRESNRGSGAGCSKGADRASKTGRYRPYSLKKTKCVPQASEGGGRKDAGVSDGKMLVGGGRAGKDDNL